ncbi:hypothetical protein BJ878DRAFT_217168 [Calycina marina]|uniref:Uncharacterized protein n=1 Tax=Calycina marina TaxID=1763456 RepID=A0A9P7Z8A1_9HELO|nr:hypothetical protein BJ878DRAFT_217168 [Calycina marina]
MMAGIQSMRFILLVPLLIPPLSNRNTQRSTTTNQPIPSLTSSQKIRRPAAVFSCSGGQTGAERSAIVRGGGWEQALANNDDESDHGLLSLSDLLRIPPHPTISDKASRTKPSSQHLDQPVLNGVAIPADRTKSGIGERQGDNSDQSMFLDDELEKEGPENEA